MKELILKRLEENKSKVKVEKRPEKSFTLTDLISETNLSREECNCIVNQLINDGNVEVVSYVSDVTSCGEPIKSTVYVEKTEQKEEIKKV